jgi:hypothetical protein
LDSAFFSMQSRAKSTGPTLRFFNARSGRTGPHEAILPSQWECLARRAEREDEGRDVNLDAARGVASVRRSAQFLDDLQ